MCGIIGYVGNKNAIEILIDGLKKLEYRGYDSAGIALINNKGIFIDKEVGKVQTLQNAVANIKDEYTCGIAHTRWATHGEPTKENAHPHTDCSGNIAIVHNGIIENYNSIKTYLEQHGHKIKSNTDTEIFAHLIEENYNGDILEAVIMSVKELVGSFAFCVIHKNHPDKIIAAKKGSPLALGIGKDEIFIASDIAAIVKYTNNIIYIDEEEIAVVEKNNYEFFSFDKIHLNKKMQQIIMDITEIEKDGFSHYMLKEIFEQPDTIKNAIRGRINFEDAIPRLDGIDSNLNIIKAADRIVLTGCGTSWHAGLIAEYYFENFARIPTETEYASEFRYRNPVLNDKTVCFFISQSGETADTIAALRESKRKSAISLGICNVVNSTIARETDAGIYLHAGPEIGVASTKAFTSQVTVLFLVALLFGRLKGMSYEETYAYLLEITKIPDKINEILKNSSQIEHIAENIYQNSNALFLGRGVNFPVALEGALKLKEISYIHSEGYPAAEMKHGPIALIDENMPVIFIATYDALYEKILANIQEVKARKGKVIAIANENDEKIEKFADYIIKVPQTLPMLSPLLNIIPLQLLAYYTAIKRGCNVDQPRNLAKSVTVE